LTRLFFSSRGRKTELLLKVTSLFVTKAEEKKLCAEPGQSKQSKLIDYFEHSLIIS